MSVSLGMRIRELRKERGLTQEELGMTESRAEVYTYD